MKVNKYLLNSLVLTATMTTSTVATTVAPVYLTHSPATVKSVSAATTSDSTVKDHVLKNQTATARFNINYGGFWPGYVSITLTYDIHFSETSDPYMQVTNVSTNQSFQKGTVGGGFTDAFFFTTTLKGITPNDGYKHHAIQPEDVNYIRNMLNGYIDKDPRYITGFYNENKTQTSGKLHTHTTSWKVPMNADGTFTPVYGFGRSRSDNGKGTDYEEYHTAGGYNVNVSIPGIVGYSFVDENGDAVPASKNKVIQGGTWTNVDGAKVPYKTNANGALELTGRSGAEFPNLPHPNFDGYTFIQNTTNFGNAFKFQRKPSAVTYHYYKNATHTIKFVDGSGRAISGLPDITTNNSDGQKWSYNIDDAIKKAPDGYDFVSVSGDGAGNGQSKSISGTYNHKTSKATTTTVVLAKSSSATSMGTRETPITTGTNTSDFTYTSGGVVKTADADANKSWYEVAKLNATLYGQKTGSTANTVATTMNITDIGLAGGTVNIDELKLYARNKTTGVTTDVTSTAKFSTNATTGLIEVMINKRPLTDYDANAFYVQAKESWKPGADLKKSTIDWTPSSTKISRKTGQIGVDASGNEYAVAGFSEVKSTTLNMSTATMSMVNAPVNTTSRLNQQRLNKQTMTSAIGDDNYQTEADITKGYASGDMSKTGQATVTRGLDGDMLSTSSTLTTPFVSNDYVITKTFRDVFGGGYSTGTGVVAGLKTLTNKLHYVYYDNTHYTPTDYTKDLDGWGKPIHVFDRWAISNPTTVDTASTLGDALDKLNGKIPVNLAVPSNAYGNVNSPTATTVRQNLSVDVPTKTTTITPYKAGSKTIVANPDAVKPATVTSYQGLTQKTTVPKYTGWNYKATTDSSKVATANNDGSVDVVINPGTNYSLDYVRPFTNKVQKLTAYTSGVVENTVSRNDRWANYTTVYAVTAKNTWTGYDFTKDADMSDIKLAIGNQSATKANIVSQHTTANADGTKDVTAYIVSPNTSYAKLTAGEKLSVSGKDAFTKGTTPAWFDFSDAGDLSVAVPEAENTKVTTDKLTQRDDLNPNNRSGRFTGSVANVVTADDPNNVKKYTETYTVSDDKTKVSVQKGYGFTNKITLSADTYAGWGASTNSAKASDTNATSVDIAGHKLTQSSAIDSRLLTQTQGLKSSGDTTLYDVTKNSQSETTKNSSVSDTADTATTNALPLSKAHVDMQWEFANSWVRHGENATQFFGSAIPSDKSNLIEVTNRQFLTPSDATPGTSYNMTLNYGAGAYQSFLYSNPRLSLTKTVNVSNGSFPDRPDYDFNNDTSFLVTTPKYDNPDVGDTSHYATKHNDATKTTQRYKDVKAFINSDN